MSRISTKFIADNAITNAKLAPIPANTVKANLTGSSTAPTDVPVASLTSGLTAFVGDSGSGGTKGLVPAPAAGDTANLKYLSANGTFTYAALTGAEISSAVAATTTSTTNVLMTGMTIIPISGTYKVSFSSTLRSSVNSAVVDVSIFVGGVQVGHSVRSMIPFFPAGGGAGTASIPTCITTQAMVAVSGSQAIEIRWKTTAGTATVNARAMDVIRMWT